MGPVNRLPSTPASDLFIIATICVILQRKLPFMELEDDHNRRYIIRHDDGLDLDYFHLFYNKYTVGRVLVSEGREGVGDGASEFLFLSYWSYVTEIRKHQCPVDMIVEDDDFLNPT